MTSSIDEYQVENHQSIIYFTNLRNFTQSPTVMNIKLKITNRLATLSHSDEDEVHYTIGSTSK
jgi:hypothetical protein